jgi:hypothetical protein
VSECILGKKNGFVDFPLYIRCILEFSQMENITYI